MTEKEEMKSEKETEETSEEVASEDIEVWDGNQFVTMENLLEKVTNEVPTMGSMKKDELVRGAHLCV